MFSKFIVQPSNEYSTLLNKIKLNNKKFNVIAVPEIDTQKLLLVNLAVDALSKNKKVMLINPEVRTDFEPLFLSKLTQETTRNLKNTNFIKKISSQEKILKAQTDSRDLTLIQKAMDIESIKALCENSNLDYLFIYRIELIPDFKMLNEKSFIFDKPNLVVVGSITEISDKIPTGIQKLDYDLLGGLDRGALFSIGGKNGSGKTETCIALGCNVLRSRNRTNESKLKVVHVSVEESSLLTIEKYYRNITGLDPKVNISPNDLVQGCEDQHQIFNRIKFIHSHSLIKIIKDLHELYEEFKYDVVIIDDLDQTIDDKISRDEASKNRLEFDKGINLLHQISTGFNSLMILSFELRDEPGLRNDPKIMTGSTKPMFLSNAIFKINNDNGIKTLYSLKNRYAMNNVTYEVPDSFYKSSILVKDQNQFIRKMTKEYSHMISVGANKDQIVTLKFQDEEFNYVFNCQLDKEPINFKFIESD